MQYCQHMYMRRQTTEKEAFKEQVIKKKLLEVNKYSGTGLCSPSALTLRNMQWNFYVK